MCNFLHIENDNPLDHVLFYTRIIQINFKAKHLSDSVTSVVRGTVTIAGCLSVLYCRDTHCVSRGTEMAKTEIKAMMIFV